MAQNGFVPFLTLKKGSDGRAFYGDPRYFGTLHPSMITVWLGEARLYPNSPLPRSSSQYWEELTPLLWYGLKSIETLAFLNLNPYPLHAFCLLVGCFAAI